MLRRAKFPAAASSLEIFPSSDHMHKMSVIFYTMVVPIISHIVAHTKQS